MTGRRLERIEKSAFAARDGSNSLARSALKVKKEPIEFYVI